MKLEQLEVYQLAMDLGERVWNVVIQWDYFAKDTVGRQLVKAADSVAGNISEGFGRYYYKENKQFCYYARGSLQETLTWLTKAQNRKLIEFDLSDLIHKDTGVVAIKLNNYINVIGKRGKQ